MNTLTKRTANGSLTRRVQQLHNSGYIYDFAMDANSNIFCVQNNEKVADSGLSVKLVDQVFDHLFGNIKYIHAIETDCGEKGILLLPQIYFNNASQLQE